MKSPEQIPFKTTLHFKGGEFNLKTIIDLFTRNNISMLSLSASNPEAGTEKRLTKDSIPAKEATFTLNASEEEVRRVLAESEFKDRIDELFGHGLN